MALALEAAAGARRRTSPNPWVGAVVVSPSDGPEPVVVGVGATEAPGGRHAEVVALEAAGARAAGATLYVTLEPCCHMGRTGPCVETILAARVSRVVVGVVDPDVVVSGGGLEALRRGGVAVEIGVLCQAVEEQLAAYLVHRRTGRPRVVLKLATTLDGRIAAPDGSARWITGPEARRDAHGLRADSDAVLVGAGTVRADDPALTVRLGEAWDDDSATRQPLRVVLGTVPLGAAVLPAVTMTGDLGAILDELGRRDVLQVLVEGGSRVAHDFHQAGLVDRYVLYLAPALFGGDDARPAFQGPGGARIEDLWRGTVVAIDRVGDDLRIELAPTPVEVSTKGTGEADRLGCSRPAPHR